MKRYVNKILDGLWSIIKLILVLLLWPAIVLLSVGVSVLFNISVEVAVEIILGILFILIGLYGMCVIRVLLESTKHKVLSILLGWVGPICCCIIGISLISN